MYRTNSDRWYLDAANRHMESRRNRRLWKQRLAWVRFAVEDWFTGSFLP